MVARRSHSRDRSRASCGQERLETFGRAEGGVGDPRPTWGDLRSGGGRGKNWRPSVGRRAGSETRAQHGEIFGRVEGGGKTGDLRSGGGRGQRPAPNMGRSSVGKRAGERLETFGRAKGGVGDPRPTWGDLRSGGGRGKNWRPSVGRRAGSETRAQHGEIFGRVEGRLGDPRPTWGDLRSGGGRGRRSTPNMGRSSVGRRVESGAAPNAGSGWCWRTLIRVGVSSAAGVRCLPADGTTECACYVESCRWRQAGTETRMRRFEQKVKKVAKGGRASALSCFSRAASLITTFFGSPKLYWQVLPPCFRKIYDFQTRSWRYLD